MSQHFQIGTEPCGLCLDSVVLVDELGLREVFPSEIALLFELKDQVRMLANSDGEMGFFDLVCRAQELEKCFYAVVKGLGLSK